MTQKRDDTLMDALQDSVEDRCKPPQPSEPADAATLRAALEAVEWKGFDVHYYSCCPLCRQLMSAGHAPGCIVGKALLRKECDRLRTDLAAAEQERDAARGLLDVIRKHADLPELTEESTDCPLCGSPVEWIVDPDIGDAVACDNCCANRLHEIIAALADAERVLRPESAAVEDVKVGE